MSAVKTPLTSSMENFLIVARRRFPDGRVPREGIGALPGNHRTWEGLEERGYVSIRPQTVRLRIRALRFLAAKQRVRRTSRS